MNASSAGRNRPGSTSTKALQKSSHSGMYITVGVLLLVAALVLGGIIWWAKKDSGGGTVELGKSADPQVEVTDKGVVVLGKKDAPKTLQIWEDFMCPACGSFEKAYGDDITKAVTDGKVRVEYHMLNFLDRQSKSGSYSTRALAAIQCVATMESVDTTYAVKKALFANQPNEGGGDRTDGELASTAASAGASRSLDCVRNAGSEDSKRTAGTSAENSLQALKSLSSQVSTPTVAYEGKPVTFSDPTWLSTILGSKAG